MAWPCHTPAGQNRTAADMLAELVERANAWGEIIVVHECARVLRVTGGNKDDHWEIVSDALEHAKAGNWWSVIEKLEQIV